MRTDRRGRVPHGPDSPRQQPLPWKEGTWHWGVPRKVLYLSTEGNGCTMSPPKHWAGPLYLAPSSPSQALSLSLTSTQTRLSPVSSALGQHGQPAPAAACTTAPLLRDLRDNAHQQSVVATPHQQGQALLCPYCLIHILRAARCLPVDLQHDVTCLHPCPVGRMMTEAHSGRNRHSASSSQKEGEPGTTGGLGCCTRRSSSHLSTLANRTPSLGKGHQLVSAAD